MSAEQPIEQHYRVNEVAAMLHVSHMTVRRNFQDRSGVRTLGDRDGTKAKRRYRTLLIPASVLKQWTAELE